MKLVFLAPFAFSPKATASSRMLPMGSALAARGHRVTILLPPYDNPADDGRRWIDAGVELENLALPRGGPRARQAVLALRMARRARALAPDALHVFKPVGTAALAMTLLLWGSPLGRQIPVVVDNDDWEGAGGWLDVLPHPTWMKRVLAWQEGWALRHATAVSAASHVLVERSRAFRGTSERTELFANGPREDLRERVDDAWRKRDSTRSALGWSSRRIVIYAGTVPIAHDLDVLVRAFARLPAIDGQRPILALAVVGDGVPSLREVVHGAGVEADVRWFDFMPHDQLVDLLCACDVGVFPYRDTPINRAKCSGKVVDYLACGLPVVLSDVGMSADYVENGVTGWLAPPGESEAFGAALQDAVTDRARAQRMGKAGQDRLWARFSWPARAGDLEKLYTMVPPRGIGWPS